MTRRCSAAALLVPVLISGCGKADRNPVAPPAVTASVTMDFPSFYLPRGASEQLSLTPRDAGGNILEGRAASWSTSDPARATVSESGVLNILDFDVVTITARIDTATVEQMFFGLPLLGAGDNLAVNGPRDILYAWVIDVPLATTRMLLTTSGGVGDVDIGIAHPTKSDELSYACVSDSEGSNESCDIANPVAGYWILVMDGFTAFSNVQLRVQFNSAGAVSGQEMLPAANASRAHRLAVVKQGFRRR